MSMHPGMAVIAIGLAVAFEGCFRPSHATETVPSPRERAASVIPEIRDSARLHAQLTAGQDAPPPAAEEDCAGFDDNAIELKQVNGRWKIVEGGHWIADFGSKEEEAEQALGIVKFYGFDRQCFVGRPDPSMTYWKRGDDVPDRDMEGQDCVAFDPDTVQVKRINRRWKIVEGSHWVADFGDRRLEAFKAHAIIRRYGLSRQCFVGHPGPSMTYWLR